MSVAATPSEDPTALPGLDLLALARWFDVERRGHGTLSAVRLAGGRSNLTYLVTDGSHRWVVRRPPVGEGLATAHDVVREHRVMAALAGTPVPVPRVIGLCRDPDVLGAPFYVMEHVEGQVLRFEAELALLGEERARRISEGLVDTLVALHAVEPSTVGLESLGRPEGFLERQVRRWFAQLEAAETPQLALARELRDRLSDRPAPATAPGIAHGDYRLDNLIVADDDRPAAVIDWEMATCGDVLTDLALLVVYQRAAQMVDSELIPTASSAPGFLGEDELLNRYAAASTHAVDRLGFRVALASFKLAGIVAGIHRRHLSGQIDGPGVDRVGTLVGPLLESGLQTLSEED